MLAVISDLHLQHISDDPFRFISPHGHTMEAGVVRNVSADALGLLLEEIQGLVQKYRVKDLQLIFNGDIFELHRTPLWFTEAGELRPYHKSLPPDELRPIVMKILDRIEEDNEAFFVTLREFLATGHFAHAHREINLPDLDLEIIYIPGNHDRLVNAWPETRRRVRDLLGVRYAGSKAGAEPFASELCLPFTPDGTGYGVLIRHGHEYDPANFSQHARRAPPRYRYLHACIGDVITVELVTYFPYRFVQLYGAEMARDDETGAFYRHLYQILIDFDDVRPATRLLAYLHDCLARGQAAARVWEVSDRIVDLLSPIINEIFAKLRRNPLARLEARRSGLGWLLRPPLSWLIAIGLRCLPSGWIVALIHALSWIRISGERITPARNASEEADLQAGRVATVIAGHTHHPRHVPLPTPLPQTPQRYFLDTGTWRTLIYQGQGTAFGRLRSLTYVVAYRPNETPHQRRFESWTGHLAADSFGPYTQVIKVHEAAIHGADRPPLHGQAPQAPHPHPL